MKRSSGILLHISSLPSRFGIGSMGGAAYAFIDFLERSGQTYWQVLPINPTGFGDSPYQSFSTHAGNPYFIDLELLCGQGLLELSECESLDWGSDAGSVDFALIYENKNKILRIAFERGFNEQDSDYIHFCENNEWLLDYAVFMAAKQRYGMAAWQDWEDERLRVHEESAIQGFAVQYKDEADFYRYIQFLFYTQWESMKRYAGSRGIKIIGDIPIYVAGDSADAWANREMFYLDGKNQCELVAGCPPDFFSEDGQYWGNPVYNWEYLKQTRYKWWMSRLKSVSKLYDIVRIDHFRGFESYYAIDAGQETARFGKWRKGPGMDFFNELERCLPGMPIIAEDLGYLTEEVHELLEETGYPGMKVLQFAFDSDSANEYLPHHYNQNCVVYTGTHDNTTIAAWLMESPGEHIAFARKYAALTDEEGSNWGMIRLAFMSVANLAVIPMQDFLNLPSAARMNQPATVGENWRWRISPDYASEALIKRIRKLTGLYGRL
ncbi:MAG: 4-alpha-glucanotransferase [Eubacteriales bacterium]